MSFIRMDNEFPERVLLIWPESDQEGIHDMKRVVCRKKLHAHWEDVDDMEAGWAPHNRNHQFWRGYHFPFPFWGFLIPGKLD
jgi:hypothetical protein